MSYDEDEEVLGSSGFNPNSDDGDLDDGLLDEPVDEPVSEFRFDEEEPELESI